MKAKEFITELAKFKSKSELDNVQRFFRYEGKESKFIGVKMSKLFALAKVYSNAFEGNRKAIDERIL